MTKDDHYSRRPSLWLSASFESFMVCTVLEYLCDHLIGDPFLIKLNRQTVLLHQYLSMIS